MTNVDGARGQGICDANGPLWGYILVGASVISTGLAFVHPQLSGHGLQAAIRDLIAGATFTGWVHGLLMSMYLCLAAGFIGFSRRLGFDRPIVTVAVVFYAVGALAMISAAVINGFGLAMFAARNAAFDPADTAAIASSINMAGSIAAVWAGIGAVASSAAIMLWSTQLWRGEGVVRLIGGFGMLLGGATIALLVSGTLILNVHGFLLLVAGQTVWTVAVGTALIGRRL